MVPLEWQNKSCWMAAPNPLAVLNICSQASSTDTCSGLPSTEMLASILLCCTLQGSTIFTQRVNLFHLASLSPNLFLYSYGVSVLCWTPGAWHYKILTLISLNDWCHYWHSMLWNSFTWVVWNGTSMQAVPVTKQKDTSKIGHCKAFAASLQSRKQSQCFHIF